MSRRGADSARSSSWLPGPRRGGVPVRVPGRWGGHRSSPGRSRPGRVLWSDADECAYAAVTGPEPYATTPSLTAVPLHGFGPFGGKGDSTINA